MYNELWTEAYDSLELPRAEAVLAAAHRLMAKEGGEPEIIIAAVILATVPQDKRKELLDRHVDEELHGEILGILDSDPSNKNSAVVHDALLLAEFNKNIWSGDLDSLQALLTTFKTASGKTEAQHYYKEREYDAKAKLRPGAQKLATSESIKTTAGTSEAVKPHEEPVYHWADQSAKKIIAEKGEKDSYTVAAGITPSGVVHIGNFREIITNDLIVKALERLGKKVRFIYSWDDYDTFRKVPKNMPDQELLQKYLYQPITAVPDTLECKHDNYAEHNKADITETLPLVGIFPEFIHQHQKYLNCDYAEDIKHALLHRDEIREILNEFKTEEIGEDWWPLAVYCESCNRDRTTRMTGFDGEYAVTYVCQCGYTNTFDLRKKGIAKLPWRVDWPMRWHKEKVDFEPGGKDHSSQGGSYDTGKVISKRIWNFDAPYYIMYDFINIKGSAGKMSSSKGNTVTLRDVLKVYTPELTRFLFAGTRPGAEFSISFDTDVFKVYEDFDQVERIYFKVDEASEKDYYNAKRIYELSMLALPKKIPVQPSFRHLTNYVQIAEGDLDKVVSMLRDEIRTPEDEGRVRKRAEAAWNWVQEFAPEQYTFRITDKPHPTKLEEPVKEALLELADLLAEQNEEELAELFYQICEQRGIQATEFFKAAYLVVIGKERGPKLANIITQAGHERIAAILKQL